MEEITYILRKVKNNLIQMLFWNYNYKKFIIITRSRTGSNLLISLLNNHPEIEAHGEIFRRLNGKTPKEIMANYFSQKPNRIKYVGFKIFYYTQWTQPLLMFGI